MLINQIKAKKALARTGIDIADFVVNPYRGCSFGCVYCYSRENKNVKKRKERWGEFVDVKSNILDLLEKELAELKGLKPARVLIGSVTEPYQTVERDVRLTRGILKILNQYGLKAVILTRSPLICEDIELLKGKHKVFFTLNTIKDKLKIELEPGSPSMEERFDTVKCLLQNNIDTRIHIGPVIPGITDIDYIFDNLPSEVREIDIELYNFKTGSWGELKNIMEGLIPEIAKMCERSIDSEDNYAGFCQELRKHIEEINQTHKRSLYFFFPGFDAYFDNSKYSYEI